MEQSPKVTVAEARKLVETSKASWTTGSARLQKRKGCATIIVPLKLNQRIIGQIRLNPTTGKIAARKERIPEQEIVLTLTDAEKKVKAALKTITVGDNIRLEGRKGCWKIPLIHNNKEVCRIRVESGFPAIMPDRKSERQAHRHAAK